MWISDQEHQQLRSVHKRTGKNLQNILGLLQPASIVVVHPLAKPGTVSNMAMSWLESKVLNKVFVK